MQRPFKMKKDHIYCRLIRPGMSDELIDLTAMFGPGNEPQTEKELEEAFPKPYVYEDSRIEFVSEGI